jgi:hypothetical protein
VTGWPSLTPAATLLLLPEHLAGQPGAARPHHRRVAPDRNALSRNGYNFANRFPRIVEAVKSLPVQSCFIDGEAIVVDTNGLASFDLLRSPMPRSVFPHKVIQPCLPKPAKEPPAGPAFSAGKTWRRLGNATSKALYRVTDTP